MVEITFKINFENFIAYLCKKKVIAGRKTQTGERRIGDPYPIPTGLPRLTISTGKKNNSNIMIMGRRLDLTKSPRSLHNHILRNLYFSCNVVFVGRVAQSV